MRDKASATDNQPAFKGCPLDSNAKKVDAKGPIDTSVAASAASISLMPSFVFRDPRACEGSNIFIERLLRKSGASVISLSNNSQACGEEVLLCC